MIIRTSSSKSGIVKYLKYGQMKDRFFSRDELDKRIILDGDIDITDNIIDSISDDKNTKYFHITLSFKEDYLSSETLENISNDFKEFITNGYDENELNYYAEAHIPKIKSYYDIKGNKIIRKPHIHIVIPKLNLINGNSFDIKMTHIQKYMDAFQEQINDKYNLQSPKDNIRLNVNNEAFFTRYKNDNFKNNLDIKSKIFDLIMSNEKINSLNSLKDELSKQGFDFSIRNPNKKNESYINIKTDKKGINLKEIIFKSEFLELDKSAKLEHIKNGMKAKKANNIELTSMLNEWNNKALEFKHVPNLSKLERDKFYATNDNERKILLLKYHEDFNNKYKIKLKDGDNIDGLRAISRSELGSISRANERDINNLKNDFIRATTYESAPRRKQLIDRIIGRDQEEHRRNNFIVTKNTIKSYDSYLDTIKEDILNRKLEKEKPKFNELNLKIRADSFLELIEKTHGINPNQYFISKDKYGCDRIKCGDHNYNPLDFCLKELNLTFKESIKLLNNTINMQQYYNLMSNQNIDKNTYLKTEYSKWFGDFKSKKIHEKNSLKNDFKNELKQLELEYKNEKLLLKNVKKFDTNLTALQFDFNLKKDYLKDKFISDTKTQESFYNLEMNNAYRKFLTEKASAGDGVALEELRRLRINYDPLTNCIKNVDRYEEYRLNFTNKIDINGVVNYYKNEKLFLKDHGKTIDIIDAKTDTLKISLQLAQKKFGNKLDLNGDDEFKKQVVEIALKNNMKITFIDDFSREYFDKRKSELLNQNQIIIEQNEIIKNKNPTNIVLIAKEQVDTIKDGFFKETNIYTFIDKDTNEKYKTSSHKLDYLEKHDNLHLGEQYKFTITDNEITVKAANNNLIRNELRKTILEESSKDFLNEIKTTYNIDNVISNEKGVFIKIANDKFNKEHALFKVDDKFIKIIDPEIIQSLKNDNPKIGEQFQIVIPKIDNVHTLVDKTNTIIEKPPQIMNYNHIMEECKTLLPDHKNIIKNDVGTIISIKTVDIKGDVLDRVELQSLNGKLNVFYLKNKQHDLKPQELIYIRQAKYKQVDIIKLPDLKAQLETNNIFTQKDFGKIVDMGYKKIRDSQVFCVSVQTIINGEPTITRHHGEDIKNKIFASNLKINDPILISKQIEKSVKPLQKITKIKSLEKDMNLKIDKRIKLEKTQALSI